MNNNVQLKQRIWLGPSQSPPNGAQVITGPHGGRYYESRPRSRKQPEHHEERGDGGNDEGGVFDEAAQVLEEAFDPHVDKLISGIKELKGELGFNPGDEKKNANALYAAMDDAKVSTIKGRTVVESGGYIIDLTAHKDDALYGSLRDAEVAPGIFKKDGYEKAVGESAKPNTAEEAPGRVFLKGPDKYMDGNNDWCSFERFDLRNAKKLSAGGSDRSAYELPDGKILKIAKTPRGLLQNDAENDGFLSLIPDVYEQGKDYVVVQKVNRDDSRTRAMLKELSQFQATHFDRKDAELQDAFQKLDEKYPESGFTDAMSYDLMWYDFISPRNWGWIGDRPYHLDGGTFNKSILDKDSIDGARPDWEDVVRRRKSARSDGSTVLVKSLAASARVSQEHEDDLKDPLIEQYEAASKSIEKLVRSLDDDMLSRIR